MFPVRGLKPYYNELKAWLLDEHNEDGSLKRGVPNGGTTGQVLTKGSGTDQDTQWANAAGGSEWGEITGTLSNQTDLQTALNAKHDAFDDGTSLQMLLSGGGAVIETGSAGRLLRVPAALTIHEVTLDGDQTGSITVDFWRTSSATYPLNSSHSICGGSKLVVSGAMRGNVSVATVDANWNDSLSYGDYLMLNVDSVSNFKWVLVSIFCKRV